MIKIVSILVLCFLFSICSTLVKDVCKVKTEGPIVGRIIWEVVVMLWGALLVGAFGGRFRRHSVNYE